MTEALALKEEALAYHFEGRPGKIEVTPTKPCLTAEDLSLAYTPGVAVPCLEIAKNPEEAFKYTSKGNLVGVISNGTAVLGLGKAAQRGGFFYGLAAAQGGTARLHIASGPIKAQIGNRLAA